MKGLLPLILGIFGTFAFSWAGLTLIPNAQIGHLDPQVDEEGNDPYPAPESGMADRGRKVYAANGCVYCHSQQIRADYAAADVERKWGERRSAPRDYLFARPVLLGKSRMGPDLANIGKRAPAEDAEAPPAPAAAAPAPSAPMTSPAPAVAAALSAPSAAVSTPTKDGKPLVFSAAWHHLHLYDPRSFSKHSNMPAFRFLYETRKIGGEPAADALKLTGPAAPAEGWEIVPSYEAKCLVAYLMSLNQSHPLNEVKNTTAAAAPPATAAPGGAAK